VVILGPETAADGAAIEALLDQCFGPGRYAKTAYRFREGVAPVDGLSFVARFGDALCGSLRFWPIEAGPVPALLLGPLAVDPTLRSRGIGIGLMILALAKAAREGHRAVMLVGDEPYYARVGFRKAPPARFTFPGPVDPSRLLIRELVPGALDGVSGAVVKARRGSAALAQPGRAEDQRNEDERHGGREQRAL